MRYLDLEITLIELKRVGFIVRDNGLLEAALSRPKATAFGKGAYPTLQLKAAALMHSVVKNHALVDGNKRPSWFLVNNFLLLNGHVLVVSQEDAFLFILSVANDEVNLEQISDWIFQHMVPNT
ncbi:MAG: hypothetical protein RL174_1034 [Actinomycetota bacterium]|jgi:death-on-curing protein